MRHNASPTRREFLSHLAAVTGAAVGGLTLVRNGRIGAERGWDGVERAASALDPAVRLSTESTVTTTVPDVGAPILFPVDATGGGLVCLNNHNGRSNARGACGHRGVDIGEAVDGTPGRPLLACVSGVIERDGVLSGAGTFRILRGDDGRWFRYHHLDALADDVAVDDRVEAGQVIGYMGRTGNTQWTHLHFEVWENSVIPRDGTAVDPVPLMEFPPGVQLDESRACDA